MDLRTRILFLVLVLILVFSLTACGKTEAPQQASPTEAPAVTETIDPSDSQTPTPADHSPVSLPEALIGSWVLDSAYSSMQFTVYPDSTYRAVFSYKDTILDIIPELEGMQMVLRLIGDYTISDQLPDGYSGLTPDRTIFQLGFEESEFDGIFFGIISATESELTVSFPLELGDVFGTFSSSYMEALASQSEEAWDTLGWYDDDTLIWIPEEFVFSRISAASDAILSTPTENPEIVGVWEFPSGFDDNQKLILNADGSFIVSIHYDDRASAGTYSFDGNTLVFQYDSPDAEPDSLSILLLSPWTLAYQDPFFPEDIIYLSRSEFS